MTTHLILGTAGHIDHGKTSLIRALTGTNTDRLPEEKKRGITIELGYAVLNIDDFRLGIVDVPGHEKFVRQMLSGATGMDLALLVVAADDSINRQTLEHLDILRMLDLPAGLIAITKCDLVEPEWLEMVEEEIRSLVSTTFLKEAPIIRTSAANGMGIDELKQSLIAAAKRAHEARSADLTEKPFRMAIDRVFSIEGHGTVVTGSVSSGSASIGETVELQPGGVKVRLKEIQNHDQAVETIGRGQRGAINLAGVHHEEIERGQELCSLGHLAPARVITVSLQVVKSCSRPVKDRQRVRFHVGTTEILGTLRLLGEKEWAPGDSGYAQIFLSDPVVCVWNQPFVLRNVSPVETVGGGRVLHPNPSRLRGANPLDLEMIEALASESPRERVAASIYFDWIYSQDLGRLARVVGVSNVDPVLAELVADNEVVELVLSPQKKLYLHQKRRELLAEQLQNTLRRMHEAAPLACGFERQKLEGRFLYLSNKEVFDDALNHAIKAGDIQRIGVQLALKGYGPQLSANEKRLMQQIIERFEKSGLTPPTIADLQKEATKNKDSVADLVKLATDQELLVQIDKDIFLHQTVVQGIKDQMQGLLASGDGISISDLRQHLGTSRRYVVPLCEYLDRTGFTVRKGDLRFLQAPA